MNDKNILPDLSPEDELELPHDDQPQLFPVYVGGVFIGYERLNPDNEEIGGQEL